MIFFNLHLFFCFVFVLKFLLAFVLNSFFMFLFKCQVQSIFEKQKSSILFKMNKYDDQLSECREIFCYFDSKGDEKINVKQVGDVLRALGQSPTESEVQKCCEQWTDPDARISFEEFVPIFQTVSKSRAQYTKDQFVEGLCHFDREGNGTIAVAELKHLLTNLGERLSEEEVEQLLAGHEVANGFVGIDSFIDTVLRDLLTPPDDNESFDSSIAPQPKERKNVQFQ